MRPALIVIITLALAACGLVFTQRDHRAEVMTAVALSGVRVETDDGEGSGTVIARRGNLYLILTCEHVLNDGMDVTIKTAHGDFPGVVDQRDSKNDLATVVAFGDLGAVPIHVATDEPLMYQTLYAVTSPLGIPLVGSEGILYTKAPSGKWGFTGFIMPGSSGGTITDAHGNLVCVAEAVVSSHAFDIVPELGFCVGLARIKEYLKDYNL